MEKLPHWSSLLRVLSYNVRFTLNCLSSIVYKHAHIENDTDNLLGQRKHLMINFPYLHLIRQFIDCHRLNNDKSLSPCTYKFHNYCKPNVSIAKKDL